jgi:hypothetical protein
MGFSFAGGSLIDEASRARCPVCRSFVYYAAHHSNSNLATKCFAITSHSWYLLLTPTFSLSHDVLSLSQAVFKRVPYVPYVPYSSC